MESDFRFFDSRQKYLLFITTTNEKSVVATEISSVIEKLIPKKPALKIFDAGLGDGTLLMNVLRKCHTKFPTIPFLVAGKEISMEDVRLTVEKLPDRFIEHPNMVFVVSNLHYSEATSLKSKNHEKQKKINIEKFKLSGNSSHEFNLQLNELDEVLKKNWQVEKSKNGNATYKDPSVLIIYRQDYEMNLENIISNLDQDKIDFDLILASQPYRSRISAEKKVNYVIKPMIESLSLGGKLVLIHSCGNDSAHEIIKRIWPEENPYLNLSKEIIKYLKNNLDEELLNKIIFNAPKIIKYNLRALPNEIQNGISTSLVFSSWNATTYVGQINDNKVLEAEKKGEYITHVQDIIKKYGGLTFNDELLIIERKN